MNIFNVFKIKAPARHLVDLKSSLCYVTSYVTSPPIGSPMSMGICNLASYWFSHLNGDLQVQTDNICTMTYLLDWWLV